MDVINLKTMRSGRLSDAVNPSVIAVVERLIMDVRRSKEVDIVTAMEILCGSAETIIYDHLKMSKVWARWVLRNLTADDRSRRILYSLGLHLRSLWISSRLTQTSSCDKLLQEMKPGFTTETQKQTIKQSMLWRHACDLNFFGGGDQAYRENYGDNTLEQ